MLQAASEHQFDVVLAKTQSRFTRDMELVEKYLHGKFVEWGIRFIAVVDHVDTNDTANKKSRQINGLINEWYLEDLSTNVRSVLDHKRKEGLFIGSFARYGYCKDPNAKGKLIIDPEAAEVVRRIFSMALNGIGAHKIARILNEEKIPSPTAYKQLHGIHYRIAWKNTNAALWSSPTVYQILHDQLYIGNMVQGRMVKISYKSKKCIKRAPEDWVIVKGTHEPLVDQETFQKIQMLVNSRKYTRSRTYDFLLKGLIFCHECGHPMAVINRKNAEGEDCLYFVCRTYQRFTKAGVCTCHSIKEETVNEAVISKIRNVCQTYLNVEYLQPIAERVLKESCKEEQCETEIRALQSQIVNLTAHLDRMYMDRINGLLSENDFH